jgi:ribosomal protein L20A (L18A)
MAKFSIQMSWLMRATVEVEADSEHEAVQKIYNQPLPQGEYAKPSIDIEEVNEVDDN